jgi:hypothetical protein
LVAQEKLARHGIIWPRHTPLQADLELIRIRESPIRRPNDGKLHERVANWSEDQWFDLYRGAISLAFPTYYHHHWSDAIIRCWLRANKYGVMGAASTAKTYTSAAIALLVWYSDPSNIFVITSSTTLTELKRRILGVIFDLHREAQAANPYLPGREVRAENGIYLPDVNDMPNLRRGIMGLATVSSSGDVMKGLRGIGVKAPLVIHVADELQLMTSNFVGASANLAANTRYRLVGLGNPTNIDDELSRLCEPNDGWNTIGESAVHRIWKTRIGLALQLPGLDTPNGDSDPPTFPGLTTKKFIEESRRRFGEADIRYRCFALGAIPTSASATTVADPILVRRMGADQPPEFVSEPTIFAGLDPAFGGGDRCALVFGAVGPDQFGRTIIAAEDPIIIPVKPATPEATVEEAIALTFRLECEQRAIPPHRAGYDSTFSSIASAIGRVWSTDTHPVMFSGLPVDPILENGEAELTTQDSPPSERFGKRVSQIVYRCREAIETGCVRGLSKDITTELSRRRWSITSRNGAILKLDVESKKLYAARYGDSPDVSDAFAVLLDTIQANGISLPPPESDRDIAASLSYTSPPDARGISSPDESARAARTLRTSSAQRVSSFIPGPVLSTPPPPSNPALVAATRILAYRPGSEPPANSTPPHRPALHGLNRLFR